MLIHDGIGILCIDLRHIGVELPSGLTCATCRNYRNLRMLFLDGLVHYVKALPELLASVLVSDAYIFEVERFRVAHLGAQCAPLSIHAAIAELDEINRVLDEYAVEAVSVFLSLKRRLVSLTSELTGYTIVEDWQRLCAQRLGQKHIFVKSHILRSQVAPVIAVRDTLLTWPHAIFPEYLAEIDGSL